MRLLLVQLSDIHLQASGNPVESRVDAITRAVLSILPHPDGCLVLVTGDIANSGEQKQYACATRFFSKLREGLGETFGNGDLFFEFIPGNHDCLLPEQEIKVREAIVTSASPHLSSRRVDEGYLNALLAPQANFSAFYQENTGDELSGSAAVLRWRDLQVGGQTIRLLSANTALLTQRHEAPGSLYLPTFIFEQTAPASEVASVNIAIYHHPSNWFEPNFRRDFMRQVEGFAHIVFNGHEHQNDEHWSESASGEHTTFIDADALQDRSYPKTSGFVAIVLDIDDSTQRYYHFRWKQDGYYPVVKDRVQKASFSQKSVHRFVHSPRFHATLIADDFGFTHPRTNDLQLTDFFTYPPLLVNEPGGTSTSSVIGDAVPSSLTSETSVYIQGSERAGKTSLLKMLCLDTLTNTQKVPVFANAEGFPNSLKEDLFAWIDGLVRAQYGDDSVEAFRQLDAKRRVLFVDNLQRLGTKQKAQLSALLSLLKQHFGLVVVTSSELPQFQDFEATLSDGKPLFSKSLTIRELPPSSRAQIVDKWLRLGRPEQESADGLVKEATREQAFLSDLIRRRALPSLPYLVLGVLQIRHNKKEDLVDPGSFGYLFQRLVIDALSVSTTPATAYVDRKDGILRRFAYSLYRAQTDGGTRDFFDSAVDMYSSQVAIRVDSTAILNDLLKARVLQETDGFISFRHHYFLHYFVARHLLDLVDSDSPQEARQTLESMADKPLVASNQLTLMFYLFFKKRDAIIDTLISHANKIFEQEPLSDIVADVKILDAESEPPQFVEIEETIDLKAASDKRLQAEDKAEQRSLRQHLEVDNSYEERLDLALKYRFALARIDLLGQVIRSFSGSLDGNKKQEILESIFRLGLRSLHALLVSLQNISQVLTTRVSEHADGDERATLEVLLKNVLRLLARLYCDAILLNISRAVGVSDIEASYEAAIGQLSVNCATQLLELAIKLDHSPTFPFALLKSTRLSVSRESNIASQVLTDLVVRHVHIVPLGRESLKRIAHTLRLDAPALISSTKE